MAQEIQHPENLYLATMCSMCCNIWVHDGYWKEGMWATKEINVSHIISVCLVGVIAAKRENILSDKSSYKLPFPRQDAIVQQQKSSADVKTAINVVNMTLVFLVNRTLVYLIYI